MDAAGKALAPRSPVARRLVPSIIAPRELSGRQDNARLHVTVARASEPDPGRAAPRDPAYRFVDQERIGEAAAWIRCKVAATLRKGAEDVGEYILCKFFRGDPKLARLRSPNKSASYRALAARCGTPELPVSKTWLNNAVGIALIARALPATTSAFRTLPPSYQETLLPIRDPAAVERLAREVVDGGVTCRELRQIVAKNRSRGALAGRSRCAEGSATLTRMRELVARIDAIADKTSLSKAGRDRMSAADTAESLRLVDAALERLGRLRSLLSGAVDAGN